MPIPKHSTPFKHLQNPSSLLNLLRHTNPNDTPHKRHKPASKTATRGSSGGLLKMFKLFPLLTSGCKMVALLATAGSRSHRRAMIADHATIGTLFGSRRGRITLAIQEDPHTPPFFVIELPMLSSSFHKEMACDILRVALESETKTHKKKLMEEFVWAVYCNGRKVGYSIRRKQLSDDEIHVMKMLRGVSMGAGVLPSFNSNDNNNNNNNNNDNYRYNYDINNNNEENDNELNEEKIIDGEQLTYLRARFERVVGSKDSEAYYMLNPDHSDGPELSIFFVRGSFN